MPDRNFAAAPRRAAGLALQLLLTTASAMVTAVAFAAAPQVPAPPAPRGAPDSSSAAPPTTMPVPGPVPAPAPAAARPASEVAVQPGFAGLHLMPGTPGYAQTGLGYLHYWSLGEGPAVLLLHGGPMFGVQFAKVMPLLAQAGFRAIAVDLPGYGLSQLPKHPPTGEEYADSLAQLLEQLGVKRAHVAGMLTGGVVTLAFATRHPARTQCVVLQHTPLYSAEELEQQLAAPPPDTRIWADGRHVTERWQARRNARKLDQASPEALQWQLVGTLLMGDPGGWWPEAGAGDYVSRSFDATRAVRELRAPTLVITLSDDAMNRYAARMLTLRPDFELAALTVGRAMVPYDFPEPWAEAVVAFLRKEECGAPAATPAPAG